MLVAPAQPEDVVGNVGTPVPREAQAESWMPGPRVARVESWARVWGAAKVVGTVQGAAEVGELGDEGVVRGRTV
jgi:hypothetical protein